MRATLLLLLGAASVQAQEGARPIVPTNGVDEKPRRGAYVETSLGVFTVIGGKPALSTAQPYLGLSIGRQIGEAAAVFGSLGLGAASASCFQLDARGDTCLGADSFGATFIEVGGSYGFATGRRSWLSLKLLGGFTDLSPGPVRTGAGVPDHLPGFHLGAGLAFDYATRLDHFAVGIDALQRYTFARYTPAGGSRQTLWVPSLAVLPRIRYVF